jgi:gliding motility-associated-like protein
MGILLSVVLLLSLFQPVSAAPRHGNARGPIITVGTPVNNQLANNVAQDEVVVNISPIPSPGVGVTFIINGGAGGDPVIPTDANGNATLQLSSPVATSFPVEAEIVDPVTHQVTVIGTVTVIFLANAGPVDPALSYLQIIANQRLADGTSQDIVIAYLYDQFGNPEPSGTPITFSIQSGTATLTASGVTSGGNTALAFFTSTVAGFVNVQGFAGGGFLYWDGNHSQFFVTIQFVALQPSLANSYITAVTTPEPADGSSQDMVQAVVLNSLGQPVPAGTAVTFTIETGTATITTTGITNASGVATAFFTSTVPGSVQVQAQVSISGVPTFLNDQSNPANNFVTIQFTVLPPTLANSYVVAVTTPASADGSSQDVVKAVVDNALGQPVPDGTVVTFTIETGTATMTTTGVTLNGVATAFFTSTVPGSVQVQAQVSISGVPTFLNDQNNPANNYVTIQFVILPPALANSYVVAVTTPVPADGSSQDVVQAVVLNSLGQPVASGTVVTFTIETGTATMTTTGITNASGVATAFFTSMVVGAVQVQAQVSISGVPTFLNDQNNPANNYVTIKFVTGPPVPSAPGIPVPPGGGGGSGGSGPGPSSPSNPSGPGQGFTYLTMTYNNVSADGVSADTATAYITDAQGHPVAGVAVYFTFHTGGPANGGALFVPGNEVIDTVYTNQNGYAAIGITDTIPGDAWVDAAINPGGTINGSSAIAHFTQAPDVNNPQTQLIVIVYEALADGTSTTAVEAHIVDATGQPVVDQMVQFSIDSGKAVIVTAQPVLTDANGNATIYLNSTTVGNVLVTATVGGKPIIFGSPARVYFAGINIYVPRAFSPNNDGTNDVLKPILVGIQTFHYFTVYNRWGNIIFTTTDPNQGWDGTFKGVPQPVETYLWIAEGIDENGKKIVAKGMTSLVR